MTINETDRTRIVEAMAYSLDHPSVYMGGPSQHSKRAAERALDAAMAAGLAEAIRPKEVERYAEHLAVSLWEKHYKTDAPQWKPMTGNMAGLLTQIDNMTAGMGRADAIREQALREAAGERTHPTSWPPAFKYVSGSHRA
jgi:hypothetical protein